MISQKSSAESSDLARRSKTSCSNKKREVMSTMTCVAPMRNVSRIASSSSALAAAASAASVTMVSQKIEAVSASVMGVMPCRIVLPTLHSLWKAWPNSCATVETWSSEPSKLHSTRDSSTSGRAMQNAPPRLPSRGSASIQCCSNARRASPASRPLNVPNWVRIKSCASENVKRRSLLPIGAMRSYHGSASLPSLPGFGPEVAAEHGERILHRAEHRFQSGAVNARLIERGVQRIGAPAMPVERHHRALDAVEAGRQRLAHGLPRGQLGFVRAAAHLARRDRSAGFAAR